MDWQRLIVAGIVAGYLIVMLGGWVLCGVGHLAARYWPAMAQSATAIAVIPTYLFARWLAQLTGYGRPPDEPFSLLALFAAVLATAIMVGLAIWQGLLAWRDEARERRIRRQGGC